VNAIVTRNHGSHDCFAFGGAGELAIALATTRARRSSRGRRVGDGRVRPALQLRRGDGEMRAIGDKQVRHDLPPETCFRVRPSVWIA
jgi:hypothetical protein